MKHKSLGCLALVLGLMFLAVLGGSVYLLSFSLTPKDNVGRNYQVEYDTLFMRYPETKPWVDSLQRVKALRDTFITTPDGDRLHALMIAAPEKTNKTAVLIHGYTRNAAWMLRLGYLYGHRLGYNLLLPDLHGHGKSSGKAVQMGWKDRNDVLRWINVADSLYRDSTGTSRIVVAGVSMGAATTMAVAGEQTPPSVKAFIEDCGYTSAWDEFAYELKNMFGLPPFPLLYTASALCKLKYGWSFGEADMVKQVEKCHKPMLFIHGDKDTFVPTAMVYELYKAKPNPKALYVTHGSKHVHSYKDHKEEYERRVSAFLAPYMD